MRALNEKTPAKIALFTLFAFLAGAVFYYKERMLFIDAPWVVYNILNSKSLFIQEHRYGSFITQVFPLVSGALHLPLKTVLLLYSVSFNLFYFISGLVLYRYRQYLFVVLLALYLTVCSTQSYYWTNNEVHQGICWMILLFGYWQYQNQHDHQKVYPYLLFALLAFLAIFSHPIVIIATVYVFGFYQLAVYKRVNKQQLVYASLLVLLIGFKYYLSSRGWYDEGKISVLKSAKPAQIKHILQTETARSFLKSCLGAYWGLSLIAVSATLVMVYKKKFLPLLWMYGSVAVYIAGICIVYPTCDFKFYIESEWMSIIILVALPFLYYVLPLLRPRGAAIVLSLLFLASFIRIQSHAAIFRQRLDVLEQIVAQLQQSGKSKVVIVNKEAQPDELELRLTMSWGLPVETLIFSSMEGKRSAVSAVKLDKKVFEEKYSQTDRHTFLNTFRAEKIGHLNKVYFTVDTGTVYSLIDQDIMLRGLSKVE